MTPKHLRSVERTLSGGMWLITFGAILFSVLTVTPLVAEVTPDGWTWTAPILPAVVDAALVIVIRLDATVARLGQTAGRWPVVLRWLTGLMTLALNVGGSALKSDWVGVAVHAVAPLLLIVTAEASLGYRRAISRALDEQETARREQQERRDRERREQQERRDRERQEREERDRHDREREIEREERRVREQREHEALMAQQQAAAEAAREREAREHDARLARERDERQTREREAAQRQADDERKARERERERRDRERAAAASATEELTVSTVSATDASTVSAVSAVSAPEKLPEAEALTVIEQGVRDGMSTRQLAAATGWSTGWVTTRAKEVRVPA